MCICVTAGVVWRYVLDSPLFWSEEVARYLFIWLVFINAASVYGQGREVKVRILCESFSPVPRFCIELLARIITLLFIVITAYLGIILAIKAGAQMAESIPMTMTYIYISISIGGILIALFTVEKIYTMVRNRKS
jgi:TRAP-type C4-dicarboxylate transport system permease small subunit